MMEPIHALISAHDFGQAESRLEALAANNECPLDGLRLWAKLALQRGDAATAFTRMTPVFHAAADDAMVAYEYGVIALSANETAQAESAFRHAVRLAPDMAAAHYNLGCLLRQTGDDDGALSAFERSVALAPDFTKAWLNLGNIHFQKCQWQNAVAAYEKLSPSPDLRLQSLINLGQAYRQVGRMADSEAVLAEYLGHAPHMPEAHCKYAITLMEAGKIAQAMTQLRLALNLDPDHLESTLWLTKGLLEEGRFEEARDKAIESLKRPDLTRGYLNGFGIALSDAGFPELGAPAFERALDLNPTDHGSAGNLHSCDLFLERKVMTALGKAPPSESPHGLDPFAMAMTDTVEMRDGKNLLWFNTANPKPHEKTHFLVLTSGNCGAIWFASALNLNPDIFASCGIDHPIESCFRYNLQKDGLAMLRASTPHHYRYGAHPQVMADIFAKHGMDYSFSPRQYHRLGWYVYDELEDLPLAADCPALGSVHGLIASQFARYYMRSRDILGQRRVVVTNMIRHPLPRVESAIKAFINHQLNEYHDVIDAYILENRDEMRRIEKAFGVSTDDPRFRSGLYLLRIQNNVKWVADELRRFRFMTALKMEDLQNDPDYFAKAVDLLTSGRVKADQAHLNEVYKPENLGVGRRGHIPDGTRPPGPESQWANWSEWERAEFTAIMRRDGIAEAYAEYDYDFSFVR